MPKRLLAIVVPCLLSLSSILPLASAPATQLTFPIGRATARLMIDNARPATVVAGRPVADGAVPAGLTLVAWQRILTQIEQECVDGEVVMANPVGSDLF